MEDADGWLMFKRVSKASSTDGSGYTELEYAGHTYGRTPDEYIESFMGRQFHEGRNTLIFFKISEGEEHTFQVNKSEQYDLVQHDKVETPITDLRWMNSGY